MKEVKILDKTVDSSNYACYKKCLISDEGNRIKFIFACGASYDVPLEYVLLWFSNPHYLVKNGKLIQWDDAELSSNQTNAKAVKCRRVLGRVAVRLYLNNNAVYDVFWDTVLMACEPKYEHFGGLTIESKKIVKEWYEKRRNEIN